MKFRNTAILALAVAALGAYLFWVERPALEEASQEGGILDVDPEQVTRLELRNPTRTMEIEKTPDGWRIVAPIQAPADARSVEALIRSAGEARSKSAIEEEDVDLARFGLEPPEATLRLFAGDRALPPLSVGKGTPIGFNAYARRGDEDRVLVTAGTVRAALSRKLTDLRDKMLADFAAEEIVALEIRARGEVPLRVERTDGGWQIVSPRTAPASTAAIAQLTRALTGLRVVEFIDEPAASAADYGLEPAALELLIETSDAPPQRLRIGSEVDRGEKKLVAAAFTGGPQVYLVASHVPAGLSPSLNQLRDKRVVEIDAASVGKIRVSHPHQRDFALIRTADQWAFEEPAGDTLDPTGARAWFQNLVDLHGQQVVAETAIQEEIAEEEGLFEIQFTDANGTPIETLIVAESPLSPSSGYIVGTRDRGPTYALSKDDKIRIDRRREELLAIDDAPSVID